jgi:hypothetical protein
MRYTTTINGHHGAHFPVAEAFWTVVGITLLLAFGDVLVVLALTVAVVGMAAAWWIHHQAAHAIKVDDAALAPVTQLRPASQRDAKKTAPQAPWRGPTAA